MYRSEPVHKALQTMKQFSISQPTRNNQQDFTIVHHNVQGLQSKMTDIQCNQDLSCADVMAVTETWLTSDRSDHQISIDGYNVHRKDRQDGRGGVCVYIKDKITCRQVSFYSTLEHCALFVTPLQDKPMLVVAMYRSPKVTLQYFLPRLQDLLHMVEEQHVHNVVVIGDFNEDQLKDGMHPITGTFADYGYQQLIEESTTRYGSMLDLIFLKTNQNDFSASVVPTYYSDHDAVKLSV